MARHGICFLITLIFLLGSCNERKGQQNSSETPVPVTVSAVSRIAAGKEISISGNIEGFKTVRLGFMVAGKVDFIACDEGESVSKGKVLASIDPSSYQIACEMADIQLNQVQDEFNRLNSMHDKQSLSESDFAKVSFGLQQARAQAKLHAKNLADTKLYSPIDGILLKKLCETGEITGVGIPVFVVSDIRKIKVSAFIPENELHYFKIGVSAKIHIPALDRDYEGIIREVGSAADPSTRSFTVKIEAENPGLLIRPGMIAEVTYSADSKESLLVIPFEALLHDINGQSFVYVADSIKKRAYRREISTGRFLNSQIEVASGLAEAEKVVLGGQQKLIDGSLIDIR